MIVTDTSGSPSCARSVSRIAPRSGWIEAVALLGPVHRDAPHTRRGFVDDDHVSCHCKPLSRRSTVSMYSSTRAYMTSRTGLHLVHAPDDLPDRCELEILAVRTGDARVGLGGEDVLERHAQRTGTRGVLPRRGPLVAQHPGRFSGVAAGSNGVGRARLEVRLEHRGAGVALGRREPERAEPDALRAEREGRGIWRPVPIPPAPSTGTGATASTTSGTSTIVAISPVCPPAS